MMKKVNDERDRVCSRISSEMLYIIDNVAHAQRMDILRNGANMAYGAGFIEGRNSVQAKNMQRVIQLDLMGKPMREFSSFADASQKTGIDRRTIGKCARGYNRQRHKTAGGFKWKLADNN